MGNSILKGMSAALLVTVITLLAGLFWTAMGFTGLSTTMLMDIGLVLSCLAAGYVTGKASGQWILGGASSLGYILLCVFLIALFLELSAWGVIQILAEGGLIGILAGAFGAGREGSALQSSRRAPRFYTWGDDYSGRGTYSGSAGRASAYDEWDNHVDDWNDFLEEDRKVSYKEAPSFRQRELKKQDRQVNFTEEDWEYNQGEEENKYSSNHRKAWWEEDVL
ncbi:YrzE family protein [Desulfitobacterium sp. THU1]|uniref:YrzE family protein n=1 Tax=Desulfitobacterium sp. THU1 TaxID=3138072 RepID=UPI00311EC720